jgi:hypothetical protein
VCVCVCVCVFGVKKTLLPSCAFLDFFFFQHFCCLPSQTHNNTLIFSTPTAQQDNQTTTTTTTTINKQTNKKKSWHVRVAASLCGTSFPRHTRAGVTFRRRMGRHGLRDARPAGPGRTQKNRRQGQQRKPHRQRFKSHSGEGRKRALGKKRKRKKKNGSRSPASRRKRRKKKIFFFFEEGGVLCDPNFFIARLSQLSPSAVPS